MQYTATASTGEDASQTHVGKGADVVAMVRNIAMSLLRRAGHRNIAARHCLNRCEA